MVFIMEETTYSPGEYIFQEDKVDDCHLFFILKGRV